MSEFNTKRSLRAWATPINTFVNQNTDVHLPLKVKGKPIQSRKQFITVCWRVGIKDNACTSLLETKNSLQIHNGAREPYIGGIQDCLLYHGVVKRFPLFQRKKSLNLTQRDNSLTELITEFVNMVIKREFLINCDT